MGKAEIRAALLGVLLLAATGCMFLRGQTYERMEYVMSPPDSRSKVLASAGVPVKLGAGAVSVQLSPASPGEIAKLASVLKALKPDEHLYVVLRDIRAQQAPGVLYDVYLDLPGGALAAQRAPYAIGTINFYNAVGNPGFFFSFDITDAARLLESRNQLSERTTITFAPSGNAEPNAEVVLGRVELIKR